ncbi:hypothetical protein COCNU_03G002740 [Cocos nucifera]|uniref:Uncharacterized protein n=1 Tax=Cocos nucifera TaxID=13894 RepID=A0A8K0I1K3_COCNU|nr:hypothetical protein COCNU_03G002740 [Cocos nucifera]
MALKWVAVPSVTGETPTMEDLDFHVPMDDAWYADTMAPKYHLAFIPVSQQATWSSASELLSAHTPSTSASASASTAYTPSIGISKPSLTATLVAYASLAHTPPINLAPLASTLHNPSASSNRIFHDPTCMSYVWNCLHQIMMEYDQEERPVEEARRYDFPNHERTRDIRLKKIGELYRNYKIKLHKGWLKHRWDTPMELVSWI